MQTFLPYPDFYRTAECLDYRRLGKQRVEAMQIINILEEKSSGWRFHPAVGMWVGSIMSLKLYCNIMIREWERRGYKNNMQLYDLDQEGHQCQDIPFPPWFGDGRVFSSHRANLLRKDPEYYGKFGWTEKPAEGYFWPSTKRLSLRDFTL